MTNDPKEFAFTAATALCAYAAQIEAAYWYQPNPDSPQEGSVELPIKAAEDMRTAFPIIARFLRTMFEEQGARK